MDRQKRRGLAYVAVLAGVVVAYTLAYDYGMSAFEGSPVSALHAFNVVVQTFTTTGYGADAPWRSPQMVALMVAMQLTGVFFIFMTLPLFVAPWVERRLEVNPPTAVDAADHVVVCKFTPRGETLLAELDAQGVDYVVVEDDREVARELHESGHRVVAGDPDSTEVLERACVDDARAVVLDAPDETNATIALSVRDLTEDATVVGFVEDPSLGRYVRYAGADRVLSPHAILGRSLADKVTSAITTELGDTVEVGDDFEIAEMPVQPGSDLDGVTLAESALRERTGASVIGAWFAGEFVPAPDPDRRIDRDAILLVAGTEDALESMKALTLAESRTHGRESIVIGGYGDVGAAVDEILGASGVRTTVVDVEDAAGVDVVGDVTEEETLAAAGADEASALILCLDADSTTIFGTLVARKYADDLEIVCRADESESVGKLYTAGADYVLSLATVSGRMLASAILGEDVMALDKQVDIVRTRAPAFVGETLAEADVRSRTGCTVIAIERDGEVLTDLGPDVRIGREDALIVAGTDATIARFNEVAGVHPEPELRTRP